MTRGTAARIAYEISSASVIDLFACDGGLQDFCAANDPDGLIIDFNRIDDRAAIRGGPMGFR